MIGSTKSPSESLAKPLAATLVYFCASIGLCSQSGGTSKAHRSGQSLISDFTYVSCSGSKGCVSVVAPRAWLSLVHGGFSTDGATELRILDSRGAQLSSFKGDAATYNESLQIVTLENERGFILYSVRDGSLNRFDDAPLKLTGSRGQNAKP